MLLLIACGPIILFLRVGQLGAALFATLKALLGLTGKIIVYDHAFARSALDLSPFLTSWRLLTTEFLVFSHRVIIWVVGTVQNKYPGDPAARTFIWCLGLWLIAAWASWNVQRDRKVLTGLLPVSILLGIILNNTDQKSYILWVFLGVFILLLGITNFQGLINPWIKKGTDFSDSVQEDSLVATLALVMVLVSIGYMVSSFSLKEIIDRMRQPQTVTISSTSEPASPAGTRPPNQASLPETHIITGGPILSPDIVMLISTGDFPPMAHGVNIDVPRYYWRTMTYQTYTGSGWINQPGSNEELPPHQMLIKETPKNYRIVHQAITFAAGVNKGLYWTGSLVQSDTALKITWRSRPSNDPRSAGFDPLSGEDVIGGLIIDQPTEANNQYTIESLLPKASEADLRAASANYPAWVRQKYLALPDTVPERVRALARDLTANAATPYDQAIAIETYLRQYPYSLDVPAPPADRDAADYFLFDLKKGYCDYYATAMTVLARAANLPARMVIGYASGTYDPFNAQYVVRQADAHAWTEIYFTGIGWIEFEPTASQPVPFRTGESFSYQTPAIDTETQAPWLTLPTFFTGHINIPWQPFTLPLLVYVLWVASDGLRLNRHSPTDAIEQLFQRLRRLARIFISVSAQDQTIREYTSALADRLKFIQHKNRLCNWLLEPVQSQIGLMADLYSKSLFSEVPLTREDTRRAIKIWGQLRWRLLLAKLAVVVKPGTSNR
jgi:transglutaminase-like putative cysteine protease